MILSKALVAGGMVVVGLASSGLLWRLLTRRGRRFAVGVAAGPVLGLPAALIILVGGDSLGLIVEGALLHWLGISALVSAGWALGAVLALGVKRMGLPATFRHVVLALAVTWTGLFSLGTAHTLAWTELGLCPPPAQLIGAGWPEQPERGQPHCDLPPG